MLYPLLFNPIHKKMIWGSESWDISCRPKEMSIIENGPLAGMAFDKAIAQNPAAFLGTKVKEFPLLVKIIEANDDLSIQVHPDDAYAAANRFESGKSEMWYVIKTCGNLIIGLTEDATPEKLRSAPMSCLNNLAVKPGDMINIPAGLVHAITKGTFLAEIQQNSDVTFRLYDYGRPGLDGKPRELHMEHGIAVSDFSNRISKEVCDSVVNSHFSVTKLEVNGEITESTNPETFTIFTCVEGSCTISGLELPSYRSVFLPAGMGCYNIEGTAVLLKTFIPF